VIWNGKGCTASGSAHLPDAFAVAGVSHDLKKQMIVSTFKVAAESANSEH
jgi:hypothetical protein